MSDSRPTNEDSRPTNEDSRPLVNSEKAPVKVELKSLKTRIENIMVHCAASNPNAKAQDIQDWFLRSVAKGGRGWSKGGYATIIEWDGKAVTFYDDEVPTNGVTAYKGVSNSNTLHVCVTGGRTEGEISAAQKVALRKYLLEKSSKYPNAKVLGHNQVAVKACPNFDARRFAKSIGIEDKNIFWEDYYEIATKMKQLIDKV